MKLRNLVLASGLALVACGDIRIEYGEPIRTKVTITQRYIPPYHTTIKMGNLSVPQSYPAKYLTTIQSNECTETVSSNFSVYDYLQKYQIETLEYRDVYRNKYGPRPHSVEKEIIQLKSKKIGCKFILPL